MDRTLKIFSLLILAVSIGGVINAASQDSVVLPATGSPMTPEWKQYNDQAETKGAPLLKYVVTAKEMTQTKQREPAQLQDSFSPTDDQLYVYTSWINVRDRPRYGIKIYDPRGVQFYERESVYQFGSERWNLWDNLYVKGWPAARVPGKWRAEIIMNGILAKTKEFYIGADTRRYDQQTRKADGLAIGVYPFFADASVKGLIFRINTPLLPLYLSQMLTIDFENRRVVMPFQLRKDLADPKIKYEDVKNFLMQELKSPDSEWNAMVKKHKVDFVITGKVYDATTYDEEKEATIYLIDVATRNLKEIKATYKSQRAYERTAFEVRANFYRAIYDQIAKPVADALK
jgi:hypothetical protein